MFTRTFRVSAGSLAAALLITGVGATAANAKPVKPGRVPGLAASATEPAIGTFDVSAHWDAATHATSYQVSVIRAGTTLASAKVTNLQWSTDVSGTPGQQLTVSVKALDGHFKGLAAKTSVTLHDLIAPRASYTSKWDNNDGIATLTEVGLVDDSPLSGVTRTVDWGDGTPVTYAAGDPITHQYPLTEKRYVPQVTLEDAAQNTRVVAAAAVVINDDEAPIGTFANQTATAWAKLTRVTVTESDINDNWTPDALITRRVVWGDGTTTAWTGTGNATHVYTTAGTYTPAVTITDEAHNAATVPTSAVVVTADTVGPLVKLILPRNKHSVKAWKTLRGKATDAGTGVKTVSLKAVEKRNGHWYGYNAHTHKWLKTTTKAKAFGRARAFTLKTDAHHHWSAKLVGLGKGTLAYKVWAFDRVNNRSRTVSHQTTLTHR
ncbi:MAG TPA: hypothetical protein VGK78_10000 [Nocardioides sp.]|uniref:hypothetical protein n=1 Tax=Nocardioides sp. TaxID=35761 RepID=UPI002F416A24